MIVYHMEIILQRKIKQEKEIVCICQGLEAARGKRHLNKDPKEVSELTIWISEGKDFQAEGRVSVNALEAGSCLASQEQ